MPVLDLSAYKPVPATLGDANQISNGFQAIVNCINALDNNNFAAGRIFDPAKIMQAAAIDGDPLVWDNTLVKWVPASTLAAGRPRAARVFTAAWSGGPPASPVDGDIWIATGVSTTEGQRWAFQYDSSWVTDAFKWKFIGGAPLQGDANPGGAVYSTLSQIAATGWYYLNNAAVILGGVSPNTRPGVYLFRANAWVGASGATTSQASISAGSPNGVQAWIGNSRRDNYISGGSVTNGVLSTESEVLAGVTQNFAPVFSGSAAFVVNNIQVSLQPMRVS